MAICRGKCGSIVWIRPCGLCCHSYVLCAASTPPQRRQSDKFSRSQYLFYTSPGC